MGMAEHMEAARQRMPRPQLGQLGLGLGQQGRRIGRIQGLEFQAAFDQGTVVVQGAAQPQLELQHLSLPPALGQQPAAGRVEQVAGMHELAVHPQLHLVGPPAQHQSRLSHRRRNLQLKPVLRASQAEGQSPPLAATRPDHQPPCRPIGPMPRPPGVVESRRQRAIGLVAAPEWLQIPA